MRRTIRLIDGRGDAMMHEVFDLDGVLVGWIGYSKAARRDVFVPRRDEDIESDRRAIAAALRLAKPADAVDSSPSSGSGRAGITHGRGGPCTSPASMNR